MVALFTVALLGHRQRSLVVGAVTGVALVWTIVLLDDDSLELTTVALRLLLVVAALAVGDTLRSRQELRAAALDESLRQEREREEKARQRVANERLRIARDLHDTLAHALVAINVRAGVAAHLQSQDPAAALLDIKTVSAEALRDLQVTLGLLRERDEAAPVSPVLDLTALPVLVDRARASGLDADVDIHVLVTTSGTILQVEVTDDGRGGTAGTEGHGLRGMEERAAALGGRVVTGPRVEGGWRVLAQLPLSAASIGET
jgi:signal transduction histidine kinase